MRLPEQLLGRASEFHHLHAQRLAHSGVGFALQVLQCAAESTQYSVSIGISNLPLPIQGLHERTCIVWDYLRCRSAEHCCR